MLTTVVCKAESATGSGQLPAGGPCTYRCSVLFYLQLNYIRLLCNKHTIITPVPVAGADGGVNEPVRSSVDNGAEGAITGTSSDVVIFGISENYAQCVHYCT